MEEFEDLRVPVEELNKREVKIVNFIEQFWFTKRVMPLPEAIANSTGFTRAEVADALSNIGVLYALEDRGIIYHNTETLSGRQLAAANVIMNFSDKRSDSKKLSDIGVSAAEYDGWRQDPVFNNYLTQRAEHLIGGSVDEAHRALLHGVRAGNTKALEMYYGITGRFSFSKSVGELNVDFLMVKIIEIITKHVSDPVALERIGNDIQALAPSTAVGQNTQPKALDSGDLAIGF